MKHSNVWLNHQLGFARSSEQVAGVQFFSSMSWGLANGAVLVVRGPIICRSVVITYSAITDIAVVFLSYPTNIIIKKVWMLGCLDVCA